MELSKLDLVNKKIVDNTELQRNLARWRLKQDKIVFTNGVFDILHKGHVDYLMEAAAKGDRLIIGLNSDSSTQKLGKGPSRPLQDQNSRAAVLAAFTYVDQVILFDEETPEALISDVKPNILVKGGDYQIDQIVGSKQVLDSGGEVYSIPLTEGYSTTKIEEKIKAN